MEGTTHRLEDAMSVITDNPTTGHPADPVRTSGTALVDRARQLVPLLRSRAAEADEQGRLTDDVAGALHDAGFFSLHTPRALGGPGAGLATAVGVHRELARGHGSAGWVTMILSTSGLFTSQLADRTQREVWGADPGVGVAGNIVPAGTARRVAGGLVVRGHWRPLSGVHHAHWVAVAAPVLDAGGATVDVALALLPLTDVTVERTWSVAGMQGTGSDTVAAEDVFVPEHRVLSLPGATTGTRPDGSPRPPVMSFGVLTAAATVVGMTEGALEHTTALLARGKSVGSSVYRNAVDSPSVQAAMAQAASLVDTARLHLQRGVGDVERAITGKRHLDEPTAARVRMDAARISGAARETMDLLLDVGGASSFALDDPVQRLWRDISVVTRHPLLTPMLNREVYSRALLGLPTQVVPLV
jgi:3-hydroxy-9,10-secoandrosta-1,3,5(10)-triene-9,17-dione monooxygenase